MFDIYLLLCESDCTYYALRVYNIVIKVKVQTNLLRCSNASNGSIIPGNSWLIIEMLKLNYTLEHSVNMSLDCWLNLMNISVKNIQYYIILINYNLTQQLVGKQFFHIIYSCLVFTGNSSVDITIGRGRGLPSSSNPYLNCADIQWCRLAEEVMAEVESRVVCGIAIDLIIDNI